MLLTAGVYTPAVLLAPLPAAESVLAAPVPTPSAAVDLDWPDYGGSAVGAVGFDGVLAASGEQGRMPMASLTKVITALVVLDERPLGTGEEGPSITFTAEDEAARIDILAQLGLVQPAEVGTALSQRDLLEGMLLASANNYAAVLARWAFGSEAAFLAAADAWLDENGLSDTVVADAMGLSPDTASTPAELVDLAKIALENPVVSTIVAADRLEIAGIGALSNRNLLIGSPGFRGIKTGTLDAAGKCLLWAIDVPVDDETVTVVGVVLGGADHTQVAGDVQALAGGVRAGFSDVSLSTEGQSVGTVSTAWGSTADVVTADDASVLVWSDGVVAATVSPTTVPVGTPEAAAGDVAYTVTGGQVAGARTVEVPLRLSGELEPAGAWWRLTHPGAVFG